jgi:carboxymethylenebutenolidase
MNQRTSFDRPDGKKVNAYRADPKQSARGAVVVIHEWYGLRPDIEAIGDRFAEQGYVAVCPDLYHGKLATSAAQASVFMDKMDTVDAVTQDVRGVVLALAREGHKVAVLGFCMGGAVSIASAVLVPELNAAVCFYGIPPREKADPKNVRVPILAHFAIHDDWCTPERVAALEKDFQAGKVSYQIFNYDAKHAFFNSSRPEVHDPKSAELAWTRTLEFLDEQLRSS